MNNILQDLYATEKTDYLYNKMLMLMKKYPTNSLFSIPFTVSDELCVFSLQQIKLFCSYGLAVFTQDRYPDRYNKYFLIARTCDYENWVDLNTGLHKDLNFHNNSLEITKK